MSSADVKVDVSQMLVRSLQDAIDRLRQDTRPICPECRSVMVKFANEHEDGSGWMCGWLCECEYKETDK